MSNKKWAWETTKNAPKNKKEAFAVFLTLLIGFIIFMGGILYIASVAYHNKHEAIDRNPGYTLCVVISTESHKGSSAYIECEINEKKRYYSEAISHKYHEVLKKGDIVRLKYSKDDINLAYILEPTD